MNKKMRFLFLIMVLFVISSLSAANQGINRNFGSDYPSMVEFKNDELAGEILVFGRAYPLSTGIIEIVQKTDVWREQLGRFLESVEEIVKKYGRQAKEIMRYLPERNLTIDVISSLGVLQ